MCFAYVRNWFERAMLEPDVNSRLVFLAHGISTIIATLILTVAFVYAKDKEVYPYMVAAVAGGSVGAAAGRWMTKKGGADTDATKKDKPKIEDNA
jgi:VIT1/CCC1 family predicted Fe2+/Mn2+ transporter